MLARIAEHDDPCERLALWDRDAHHNTLLDFHAICVLHLAA